MKVSQERELRLVKKAAKDSKVLKKRLIDLTVEDRLDFLIQIEESGA